MAPVKPYRDSSTLQKFKERMRESQKSHLHMPKKVLKTLYDDVDFGDKNLGERVKEYPAETSSV